MDKGCEWERELGPDLAAEKHHGQGIPAWIKDKSGTWNFDRRAMEDSRGGCPLDQMAGRHELMIAPGLIYRLVPATPRGEPR